MADRLPLNSPFQIGAGTMPVSPQPVNWRVQARIMAKLTKMEPRRAWSPSNQGGKDDPRIWPECGAVGRRPRYGAAGRAQGVRGAFCGSSGKEKPITGTNRPDAVFDRSFFKKSSVESGITGRQKAKKARQIRISRMSHGRSFSVLTIRTAKAYTPPIGALYRKLRLRRRASETPHWFSEKCLR